MERLVLVRGGVSSSRGGGGASACGAAAAGQDRPSASLAVISFGLFISYILARHLPVPSRKMNLMFEMGVGRADLGVCVEGRG